MRQQCYSSSLLFTSTTAWSLQALSAALRHRGFDTGRFVRVQSEARGRGRVQDRVHVAVEAQLVRERGENGAGTDSTLGWLPYMPLHMHRTQLFAHLQLPPY